MEIRPFHSIVPSSLSEYGMPKDYFVDQLTNESDGLDEKAAQMQGLNPQSGSTPFALEMGENLAHSHRAVHLTHEKRSENGSLRHCTCRFTATKMEIWGVGLRTREKRAWPLGGRPKNKHSPRPLGREWLEGTKVHEMPPQGCLSGRGRGYSSRSSFLENFCIW